MARRRVHQRAMGAGTKHLAAPICPVQLDTPATGKANDEALTRLQTGGMLGDRGLLADPDGVTGAAVQSRIICRCPELRQDGNDFVVAYVPGDDEPLIAHQLERQMTRRVSRRNPTAFPRAQAKRAWPTSPSRLAMEVHRHHSTDFSMNPSVLAFSTNVRTLARSRPPGTSASISSLSFTWLPGSVVSCSMIASTI